MSPISRPRSMTLVIIVLALVGCASAPPTAQPPTPWPTVTPPAGLTAREAGLLAVEQSANSQAAASGHQCVEVFKTETGCNIILSIRQVTRPEWDQLFPDTQFYLVDYDRITASSDEPRRHLHFLIAEKDGQRYSPETYDQLMIANHVDLTEDNRELVARGWALLTIGESLADEVRFTSWEPDDDPLYASNDSYVLKAWARFGGAELSWSFIFGSKKFELITIGPRALSWWVGDFTGTPDDTVYPLSESFYFFPR